MREHDDVKVSTRDRRTSNMASETSDSESSEYLSADSETERTSEISEDDILANGEYSYDCVASVEPIATSEEAEAYATRLATQQELEEILWSRFSGEEDVKNWLVQ